MPSYEGRDLPRPDDEVFDQGLGFDLGTLSRRGLFRAFGAGAVTLGLASCGKKSSDETASTSASTSASSATTGEIPDETAGPYPGDGSNGPNVLTESGIVRSDITSSFGDASGKAEGVPMTLTLTITDLTKNGAAFAGVAVYVWHCTRSGEYSMYSTSIAKENYLRGVQIADAAGQVTFTSIFPACYSGRWPHIHFEVYPDQASISSAANAIATSQVAMPKADCDTVFATTGYEASVANFAQISLDSDNVFGDDSGALQLATVSGDATAGYIVALTAGVDTTTTPTGGAAPAGGDGAPSGAPGSGGPGGAPPSGPRPSGAPPS